LDKQGASVLHLSLNPKKKKENLHLTHVPKNINYRSKMPNISGKTFWVASKRFG
jgi:hypothetical protein